MTFLVENDKPKYRTLVKAKSTYEAAKAVRERLGWEVMKVYKVEVLSARFDFREEK